MGTVFNIQRYSIDDGPGIRTTVFLKGCPLRCTWCCNPESQKPWPEVMHRTSLCVRCGRCAETCEVSAIVVTEDGVSIDRDICTRCGECVEACPNDAMRMMGAEMSVEDVFAEIERDMDYYRDSGGGVTLSGGEVLSQSEFALSLFRRCKDEGIHTCLDTSGHGDTEKLESLLPYVDLVYFDVKQLDPEVHRTVTGHSNELILRNLATVAASGIEMVVRVPVIPGVNDSDEAVRSMAERIASLAPAASVHLLPYHRLGSAKYAMLGREYPLGQLAPLSPDALDGASGIVEAYGMDCEVAV